MTPATGPTRLGRLVGAIQYLVGVATATTVVLLFTLGADPDQGRRADPDTDTVLGREIYAAECAICHGAAGGGGTGPALGPELVDEYPDPTAQELIVARGINSMVGFESRLSPNEIAAVVTFTRTDLATERD